MIDMKYRPNNTYISHINFHSSWISDKDKPVTSVLYVKDSCVT